MMSTKASKQPDRSHCSLSLKKSIDSFFESWLNFASTLLLLFKSNSAHFLKECNDPKLMESACNMHGPRTRLQSSSHSRMPAYRIFISLPPPHHKLPLGFLASSQFFTITPISFFSSRIFVMARGGIFGVMCGEILLISSSTLPGLGTVSSKNVDKHTDFNTAVATPGYGAIYWMHSYLF